MPPKPDALKIANSSPKVGTKLGFRETTSVPPSDAVPVTASLSYVLVRPVQFPTSRRVLGITAADVQGARRHTGSHRALVRHVTLSRAYAAQHSASVYFNWSGTRTAASRVRQHQRTGGNRGGAGIGVPNRQHERSQAVFHDATRASHGRADICRESRYRR